LIERHPDRVIDVGIAEQHAVTSAAGLAHAGLVPVFAVYSTFLSRAFDQTNTDVALHGEHVVYAVDRAGVTGDDGPSHHGILDMALALRVPGMAVLAPSCEEDLVALLEAAVERDGPVLLRFPKGAVVARAELGPAAERAVAGLAARRLRDGGDGCILAVGDRVAAAVEAATSLAADGMEFSVYDVRSVRPADPEMIAAAAASPLVLTVENGMASGGAGAYLAELIEQQAGVVSAPPVVRLGVPTAFLPHGDARGILAGLGLDASGIAAAARRARLAVATGARGSRDAHDGVRA